MWKLLADVLDYHRSLIGDRARVDAFRAAIFASVRPGDVVLDIGTGSGLLSLFACQAGAAHVYAVEQGVVADLAEVLFRDNDASDRISLIRAKSNAIALPECVDVVVSETLWNLGLGEGIVATLSDAAKRFLKPGGRIIPSEFQLHVAPVMAPDVYGRISDWDGAPYGMDLSSARRMAVNNLYRAVLGTDGLLSAPSCVGRVELGGALTPLMGEAEFRVDRDGVMHGLGGWFRAQLAPSISLTNEPPNPSPSWKQAFMPIEEPLRVKPGDTLRVEVQCLADESAWRWTVRHLTHSPDDFWTAERCSDHTTLGGFPTARQRLSAP